MKPEDAAAWKSETEESPAIWRISNAHNTPVQKLIYKGGFNGVYVRIRKFTTGYGLEVGYYQNAIPQIQQATLLAKGKKFFPGLKQLILFLLNHVPSIGDAFDRLGWVKVHYDGDGVRYEAAQKGLA
jgi:hypothetical protein